MQLPSEDSSNIPEQYLSTVIHHLNGFRNDTLDFSKPYLNPYFATIYPIPVIIYSLLIILSILVNLSMIYHVFKHDIHKEPTCAYLVNIAIANVIHVVFALPITLAVLLMHNWIFGKFICYSLPMLQDTPIHVSMMTYLLIAGDRYRFLSDPRKPRFPAFVCALGTWFFATCIVLPYPIYTTYFNIPDFDESKQNKRPFQGVQMCIANLSEDIQEYIRSLFIATYIAPLTITSYICVKSGQELQSREAPVAVAVFLSRGKTPTSYSRQNSNASNDITLTIQRKGTQRNADISSDLDESEFDIQKEKRTQKYLILMITTFAICLCPLMILRLARAAVKETYENSRHLDITYVTFVWVAFLPGLITPCLYASWQINRKTKERLQNCICFLHRRHTRVCENDQQLSTTNSLHQSDLVASNSMLSGTSRCRDNSSNSNRGISSTFVNNSIAAHTSRSSKQVPPINQNLFTPGYSSYKNQIVL